MLVLKNICKDYITGDTTVRALSDININFRESEFVTILGQSGSGKTTMLNIIGGLDQYDKGDLVINGKSTKKFTKSTKRLHICGKTVKDRRVQSRTWNVLKRIVKNFLKN